MARPKQLPEAKASKEAKTWLMPHYYNEFKKSAYRQGYNSISAALQEGIRLFMKGEHTHVS